MKAVLIIFFTFMSLQQSFKETQLKFQRVKDAYSEKEITVKKYFINKNLNYQGYNLFLKALKKERILEVWIKQNNLDRYVLLTTYSFCSSSGSLGPKRKEGDGQIPEGLYHLNHFNPQSNFHLSLGINYPNQSDKILSDKETPGSAIYVHGNCVTIGCIPITDDKIKELYLLAIEARNNGQEKIPIFIFPSKLGEEDFKILEAEYAGNQTLIGFWKNLQSAYLAFEKSKTVPAVRVDSKGKYLF